MNNKNYGIAYDRKSGIGYSVSFTKDGNGLVISRRRNGTAEGVATFIDCNEFVSTAVKVNPSHIQLMSRCPSSEYSSSLPPELHDKFEKEAVLRLETKYGNLLKAHLSDPDYKENVFKKLIITRDEGDGEKVVAHIIAEPDYEITVTSYGYPAGPEIE